VRNLAEFGLDDVTESSDVIRGFAGQAKTMEGAAQLIARYLYDDLRDGQGDRACALVRLYKTHPFGRLEPTLQTAAREAVGHELAADVRCLTLLGTAGDEEAWNDRRRSVGHRVIPLTSEERVRDLPMVTQLIVQLGLDLESVLRPEETDKAELAKRSYDAFHVPVAAGSPYLPAQEGFVIPYGIQSAIGFGGMLHTGDFYAVVLFSKVPVSADVAQTIKILALAVRVPLMAFLVGRVFETA
jgi:hypothetical protein